VPTGGQTEARCVHGYSPGVTDEQRKLLSVAIEVAREAAAIQEYHRNGDLGIETKLNDFDLVTQVDKLSEKRIREVIAQHYPEHEVLGEEMGGPGSEAPYRWIVDPIDGTVNYAHGFPFYCVSIGVQIEGQLEVGVILDGARNELFTAVRGEGAFLNGVPLTVTSQDNPRFALLGTGFAYDPALKVENTSVFMRVQPQVRAIRRAGAAALDLAYVACGRLDGFWELALKPWDVAAGVLLVEEAGGTVSAGDGSPYELGGPVLVATNGPLHGPLVELLELNDVYGQA